MPEEVFLTASSILEYLQLFFNAEANVLVSYGFLKAEIETYIQDTNQNPLLRVSGEDLIDSLTELGYESGQISCSIFQCHVSADDFNRLKAINKPVNADNLSITDEDLANAKWLLIEMDEFSDEPLYLDEYGLKMLYKNILIGFENDELVFRQHVY
jgi:hypothetical protein